MHLTLQFMPGKAAEIAAAFDSQWQSGGDARIPQVISVTAHPQAYTGDSIAIAGHPELYKVGDAIQVELQANLQSPYPQELATLKAIFDGLTQAQQQPFYPGPKPQNAIGVQRSSASGAIVCVHYNPSSGSGYSCDFQGAVGAMLVDGLP